MMLIVFDFSDLRMTADVCPSAGRAFAVSDDSVEDAMGRASVMLAKKLFRQLREVRAETSVEVPSLPR